MKVQSDRTLDIAIGPRVWSRRWKNEKLNWSALLDKLCTTTRTQESIADYFRMSKKDKSSIKDVGGFVGGYAIGGNRSDMKHRSVLTLDADFAEADLWEDWGFLFGCEAAIYSTHSHTPDKPRFRLVVPLDRNVDADEYQAIGRMVAKTLGINQFDDTTYQVQRVMFWPSTAKDGEYVFEHCEGPLLKVDDVLASYVDWHDMSAWPASDRVSGEIKKAAKTQKDPLEKKGLIGAFCRAYTIQEAIAKYVPDYEECANNRYTYTQGSTFGGVIIYDDKFSYSHHGTDPASMQLCNAWDLVRLHHFADLDADIDPQTPPASRPSYKAMCEFVRDDELVKMQVVADRVAEVSDDFDVEEDDPLKKAVKENAVENLPDWYKLFKMTDKGAIAQCIENAVIVLKHDPGLVGAIALNELSHDIVAIKKLPWRDVKGESLWSDADDSAIRYYMERVYGITGKDKIFDAVNVVANENAFHPIRNYLDGLKWDGQPRIDTLFIDYLGAEDDIYIRTVTRKTLCAAVARIYEPGTEFQYMTVLYGTQGLGKSQLVKRLGGPWFSDSFSTLAGKEAFESVQGVWIIEVGELAGLRKAEDNAVKQFISKAQDRFRPAYGRRTATYQRQCVFIGTTNERQFLRDFTGNRRFWVVDTPGKPVKSVWRDLTKEEVGQIWAEAIVKWRDGESQHLNDEIENMAREAQESFEEENPRIGLVADYLDRMLPSDWYKMDTYDRKNWLENPDNEGTMRRAAVCTMEIWVEALGGNPEKFDRYASKEISAIMAKLPEWKYMGGKMRACRPYGRQRYYERSVNEEA